MEIVKVLSPVQDNNIQKNINDSPIWKGKRYHESELAIAEKENSVLYEYSFKFEGLKPVQFTGVKKLAKQNPMEDISPIYEDVDIRAWAQDIRLTKIRELEYKITEKQKLLINIHPSLCCIQDEVNNLQHKLGILYGTKENE